jgi:O-antigen ligase
LTVQRLATEWRKYALGTVMVLAMMLGGGAASGLWTDSVLEAIILLVSASVLADPNGEPIDRRVLWLVGAIVCVVLLQMIPLPAQLSEAVRPALLMRASEGGFGFSPISTDLGGTLGCLLYVSALASLLLAMLRIRGEGLHGLLPFFLTGVALNLVVAAIQYGASAQVEIATALPFTATAGVFANRNHLASLLYASLPFLIYLATFRGKGVIAGAAMLCVLLILLAAGSRAGALIGIAVMVLSTLFLSLRSRVGLGAIAGLVASLGVYAMGSWNLLETRGIEDLSRMQMARTTLEGITDNWLFGVGFGTFARAYPIYQDTSEIVRNYVNHAHNDFLELVFEGGILSVVLLLSYIGVVVWQVASVRYNLFQKAAALSILFILVHSVVDYPLRTLAVAVPFIYFNALLFHLGIRPKDRKTVRRVRVRHNGREMNIPIEAP